MEFVVESGYGITVSTGDLLLLANSMHDIAWITCVLEDDARLCTITAASRCRIIGDLDFVAVHHRCANTIWNITYSLYGDGIPMNGIWRAVPRSVWPSIYEFIHSQVY